MRGILKQLDLLRILSVHASPAQTVLGMASEHRAESEPQSQGLIWP